jgi:outer membrane protein assembly factor BamE (lipoprotein component of BamABCDE complex)
MIPWGWHTLEVWLASLVVTIAILAGFGMFARWACLSPAVRRDKLAELRVGMNADEVTALLGKPRDIQATANGAVEWTFGPRVKRHLLIVQFNAQKIVTSFAHGIPAKSRRPPPGLGDV